MCFHSKTITILYALPFPLRTDGIVYITKWNDNSVVNVASNCLTHEPVRQVRRRVKNQPNQEVSQPNLIRDYNQGMGGVDLMDRLLASYRPTIRGKKWYWPLFINALNVSVVAAWRVHCKVADEPLSHLDFRREIAVCLLKTAPSKAKHPGGHTAHQPQDVRYDGVGHTAESTKQGRCKECQKNCRYICIKCKVRLHFDHGKDCFRRYHEKE